MIFNRLMPSNYPRRDVLEPPLCGKLACIAAASNQWRARRSGSGEVRPVLIPRLLDCKIQAELDPPGTGGSRGAFEGIASSYGLLEELT
jgi:hypothetical protein